MKGKNYADQHKEIRSLVGLAEIRNGKDNLDKAVKIIRTYVGDVKLTKRGVAKYFGFSRTSLEARMWSTLLGYETHGEKKPRYLSPKWEAHLKEHIDLCRKSGNSLSWDDMKLFVK